MSSQEPFNLDDVPPVMEQGESLKVGQGVAADPMLDYPNEKPAPLRVWPTYVSFVIVLVVSICMGLIAAAGYAIYHVTMIRTGEPTEAMMEWLADPWTLSAMGFVQFCILMAAALIAAKLSPLGTRLRLDVLAPRVSWLGSSVVSIGAVGYSICFVGAAQLLQWKSEAIESITEAMKQSAGASVFLLLVVGILAPVGEELYFRGYVQSRLGKRHGPVIGILVASLFFGILHMDLQHSLFAMGFGIYIGALAWKAGSIYPAILAHGLNNCWSVVGTWWLPETTGGQDAAIFSVAAVAFVGGIVALVMWPRRETVVEVA